MELLENEYIYDLLHGAAYFLSAFIILIIGVFALKASRRGMNLQNELVIKDNLAFALQYAGYLVGLILVIGGAIVGPHIDLVTDLIQIFSYGIAAIVLLNISSFLNDKIVFRQFSMHKEIVQDKNVGTGIIEGANYIANGLILFGAISGENYTFTNDYLVTAGFWLAGQVFIMMLSFLFNLILPYKVHDHIEKDNAAVGIGYAGAIIAIGNLIRHGLQGDFVHWQDTGLEVVYEVGIGFLVLPIARFVIDKVLLPKQKLTDEIINQEKPNHGAAVLEAFSYIGSSVLITWCF